MKHLSATIIFALACLSAATGAELEPVASDQHSALTREREAIRNAASRFITELRKERVEGLPTVEQMRRLSPLVMPELTYLIERARGYREEQVRKYPDEKPYWIEGDLFSSSFEGVTSWQLGEIFSAPTVDATVQVKQTYTEPGREPVIWTDTLFFKQNDGRWRLNDIRMDAKWEFKSGPSLRGILPGGERAEQDHDSLDERWHVAFTRKDDDVTRITIEPKDQSAPPAVLFGGDGETCPMPTWVVWNPECDKLAVRLGDGPRFTRTLIFRLAANGWQPVKMPEFYPEEKATMISNGFAERDSLIDADHWHDAHTLVVQYFGSYSNDDDGDGYFKNISIRIDTGGGAEVVGAVDAPNIE